PASSRQRAFARKYTAEKARETSAKGDVRPDQVSPARKYRTGHSPDDTSLRAQPLTIRTTDLRIFEDRRQDALQTDKAVHPPCSTSAPGVVQDPAYTLRSSGGFTCRNDRRSKIS